MEINECYRKNLIKHARVNLGLIKSLIEMSEIKENIVRNAGIDKISISAYFVMAYDSLREVLEAVCISKGYKVLSHECLGELMKELFPDFNYVLFDRIRYARNGVNYYGVKIDFEQGKEMIKSIFKMKKECKEYLGSII